MMRCGERGARSGDCSSLMLPGRPGLGHRPTRPHLLCTVGPECTLGPDGGHHSLEATPVLTCVPPVPLPV